MSEFDVTQPPITTRPLGDPPAWSAALAAAGNQCQCTGACGRTHGRTGRRCDREHDVAGTRLIAAPGHLSLPETIAANRPTADLRAWCPTCYDLARRRHRAADAHWTARTADREDRTPTLFDL